MISRKVVKQFLKQPADSFAWMKKLTRRELRLAISELDPTPEFHGDDIPWNNQLVGFLLGVYFERFMFLMDMGIGKTRVVLDLIAYRKLRGERTCFLVCVLNRATIENWVIEIEKYAPTLDFVSLDVKPKERRQLLNREADLFIVHYPGLRALCSTLRKKKSKRRKRYLDKKKIKSLLRKFNGLVLDESTVVMNKQSLIFRICNQFSRFVDICFGLTGTPFGKDPMPLWAQFFILDRGETLGPTLGLFREALFKKKRNEWGGGWDYKFDDKKLTALSRLIGHRSITYVEGECQDLPERVPIRRVVLFTSEMEQYYERTLEHLRKVKGNWQEINHSFLRMRQISSGFLGLKDDETGARAQIEFPANPKLDALMEAIDEMPADAKMLVYHEYIWTGNRISRELKARKIKHERLWGGQKHPRRALRRFVQDPSYRIFVINNNSGAMSLNLQVACYLFFFESSVRPIIRTQAERRARRSGQKSKRVFVIDPIVKSETTGHSVDERILAELARGQNLMNRVLRGKVRL